MKVELSKQLYPYKWWNSIFSSYFCTKMKRIKHCISNKISPLSSSQNDFRGTKKVRQVIRLHQLVGWIKELLRNYQLEICLVSICKHCRLVLYGIGNNWINWTWSVESITLVYVWSTNRFIYKRSSPSMFRWFRQSYSNALSG